VINAAGPFERTALPLAQAALRNRRHYVDINGEADVYRQLDDFGYLAKNRGIVIASGVGHSAATSDVALARAIAEIRKQGIERIGVVRIAFSHVRHVSRGSAQTAWRSIRDQAMVMRAEPGAKGRPRLEIGYEPSGRIERVFDFGEAPAENFSSDERKPPRRRIAMLANLLDLLTARLTLSRSRLSAQRIESFIELPEGARPFVQLGALSTPLYAWPAWRRFVRAQVDMLPEGPTPEERRRDRHTVLLQIDDGAGRTLVDDRIETPDPYDFTADCVLSAVEGLDGCPAGWRTPSKLIRGQAALDLLSAPRCKVDRRATP
jgi:short subunit dehydrogenase-like uncharacterized protein